MIFIALISILMTFCCQIWPSSGTITIVVVPNKYGRDNAEYLVQLEGKHVPMDNVWVELMKMTRTKVIPPDGMTVENNVTIPGGHQFVQIDAAHVRELVDGGVYATTILVNTRIKKTFFLPMEEFMMDNAMITLNFETGISRLNLFGVQSSLGQTSQSGQESSREEISKLLKAHLQQMSAKWRKETMEKMAQIYGAKGKVIKKEVIEIKDDDDEEEEVGQKDAMREGKDEEEEGEI